MSNSWGDNPEKKWASKYSDSNQPKWILRKFCGFTGKSPVELLEMQSAAMKSQELDDRYEVLNRVQDWINQVKGRRQSKRNLLSTVRSFFEFHHRPLPPNDKNWVRKLQSDTGAVEGKVTPNDLRAILTSIQGDPRKQSMFLVQLQSFSGPRELCIVGNEMGVKIGEEIRKGANLIELHFEKGRKHSDKSWFSYIGKEACEALRKWFEGRGFPTKDDPLIWKTEGKDAGRPINPRLVYFLFAREAGRLAMRPRLRSGGHTKKDRYGVSVKELRDLGFSLAQRAVGTKNERDEIFLESSIEYFGGHTVDPMNYRKIHKLDPEFRKRQYQIVEPYLSPVSAQAIPPEVTDQISKQALEMDKLTAQNSALEARLAKLEAISVERLMLAAANTKQSIQKRPKKE